MDATRRLPEKEQSDMPVTSSFDKFETGDRGSRIIEIAPVAETRWEYLRRYFTTRDGWIGNYVCRTRHAYRSSV